MSGGPVPSEEVDDQVTQVDAGGSPSSVGLQDRKKHKPKPKPKPKPTPPSPTIQSNEETCKGHLQECSNNGTASQKCCDELECDEQTDTHVYKCFYDDD
jgi:hypothetical protein